MSNPAHVQEASIHRNRTCRDVGHEWQATTSDLYRVCARQGCHATQRRVQGGWINALPQRSWTPPVEATSKHMPLPEQQALF
jgi:hypothetical protein